MGLYNMIFGQNQLSDYILATLGLTRAEVGRFRDVYIVDNKIAVYTRNGGGNRECWNIRDVGNWETEPLSENCGCPGCIMAFNLPNHPNYLYDEDDEFDCTYATIFFSFPAEYAEDLKQLETGEFNPSDNWRKLIEQLRRENGL